MLKTKNKKPKSDKTKKHSVRNVMFGHCEIHKNRNTKRAETKNKTPQK